MFSKPNTTPSTEVQDYKKLIVLHKVNLLYHSNMSGYVELIEQCRNPSNHISSRMKEILQFLEITDEYGNLNASLQDAILAQEDARDIEKFNNIDTGFRSKL